MAYFEGEFDPKPPFVVSKITEIEYGVTCPHCNEITGKVIVVDGDMFYRSILWKTSTLDSAINTICNLCKNNFKIEPKADITAHKRPFFSEEREIN